MATSKPTKQTYHELTTRVARRGWMRRETLATPLPVLTSKHKPLVDEAISTVSGIIPHPTLGTKTVFTNLDINLFYEGLYRADAYCRGAVEVLTNYTIQNDFHLFLPEKQSIADDIHQWMRLHGFYSLMENFSRCLYLFGNVYLWKGLERIQNGRVGRPKLDTPMAVTDHRIVHPAWMFVIQEPTGQILGYVQKKTATEISWGKFDINEMIHVPYRPIADRPYGYGIFDPIIRDLNYERVTEADLIEILHDYAAPLVHWKLGYTNPKTGAFRPASPESIAAFAQQVTSLAPNDDLVTDIAAEHDIVGGGREIGNVDPYLKHFKKNYIAGLGVPDMFFGSAEATSQNIGIIQHEMVVKSVHAGQNLIKYVMETQFIPYVMVEIVKDTLFEDMYSASPDHPEKIAEYLNTVMDVDVIKRIPRMEFYPIESDKDRHARLRESLNAGGITFNEFRKRVAYQPYKIQVKLLGKLYNLGDLTPPILNALVSLETAKMQQQQRDLTAKGERTPQKTRDNTQSVDGTGNPVTQKPKTDAVKKV